MSGENELKTNLIHLVVRKLKKYCCKNHALEIKGEGSKHSNSKPFVQSKPNLVDLLY